MLVLTSLSAARCYVIPVMIPTDACQSVALSFNIKQHEGLMQCVEQDKPG